MSFLFALVLSSFSAHAESLYAMEDVKGVRWPGATLETVELSQGDKVEVLAREGELVRVLSGARFGWVAAGKLGAEPPPEPAAFELPIDLSASPPSP